MSDVFDPVPASEPPVKGQLVAPTWYRWFDALRTRVLTAAFMVASAHKAAQSAAITTTTLYTPSRQAVYRVSWTLQVTQAATTSSSVQVTLSWKANGVAQTETFTALTGNTTGTHGSGSVTIRTLTTADVAAISYATSYASVGATPMVYTLDVVCESQT